MKCAPVFALLGKTLGFLACAAVSAHAAASGGGEPEAPGGDKNEKLTIFTAMHSYPYTRAFGKSSYLNPRYVDRPLYWNPNYTSEAAAAKKAALMDAAGADVLAQTTFFGFDEAMPVGDSAVGRMQVIGRMLEATAGTSMRVAPEVVMMKRAENGEDGRERLVAFLRALHEKYADHPRAFRKDGKMVVFLWNPFGSAEHFGAPEPAQFGPDDVAEIWAMLGDLRDKFYFVDELYYHVRTDRERLEAKWDPDYIERLLGIFDNAFYWHSQGNGADEKLWNGLLASDIRRFAPGEPVIVGSRPGYYRSNTGWLNPARGTGKLLELWGANQTVEPDWNFFYNWDDYEENGGVIEPTYRNRGVYSAVIETLTRAWKGLPPEGGRQVWFGSRSVAARGQRLTTEVSLLRNDAPVQSVTLALESNEGEVLWANTRTEAEVWAGGRIRRFAFSAPTVGLDADALNPRITVRRGDGERTVWRGVAPIRLMAHHPMLPLYRFTRLDRVRKPEQVVFEVADSAVDDTGEATVRGHFRVVSDKPIRSVQVRSSVDVPQPYASDALAFSPEVSIRERGYNPWYLPLRSEMPGIPPEPLHRVEGAFDLGSRRLRDALCGVYLFVEYRDGGTWATETRFHSGRENAGSTRMPLLDWRPVPGTDATRLETEGGARIPEAQAVIADWPMSRAAREGDALVGAGRYGWRLYLGYGPNQRRHQGDAGNAPQMAEADGRRFLRFDGRDDVARLPQRVFPPAAFRLELRVRLRELPDQPTPLFVANRGLLRLEARPDGTVAMHRLGAKVRSTQRVPVGEWFSLGAEDDGEALRLTVDGDEAVSPHEPLRFAGSGVPYADLAVFGGRSGNGFAAMDLARATLRLPHRAEAASDRGDAAAPAGSDAASREP